ncbi:MAG: hypothetical protein E6447_11065 [Bradyrhizobium sp.]|nr:hypothetical protein [Bradyrhizobium sp.]
MTLIIGIVRRSLLMTIMISIITIIIDVPTTNAGVAFNERLEKHPHPCRKSCHTGSEIRFEGRSHRGIFEKIGELAPNLITFSFTNQEIAQPVKRLDDAHRWSSGPE